MAIKEIASINDNWYNSDITGIQGYFYTTGDPNWNTKNVHNHLK